MVDYWGLNKVTIKNRYLLPLIHELITRFTTAWVFSKVDLCGVYNLVQIKKRDEWKLPFDVILDTSYTKSFLLVLLMPLLYFKV